VCACTSVELFESFIGMQLHNLLSKFNVFSLNVRGIRDLGWVVQKPVNATPGLKVNRGNNFSYLKVLSIAYVLCSLRYLMLKTEGQKI